MEPISKPWYQGPKIIYLLLALIIIGELIWSISNLIAVPAPKAPSPSASAIPVISDARISLISDKNALKVGEKAVVNVTVSTGGYRVAGVDLILKYDPKILQASPSGFIKGNIFPEYPLINIDNKNGLISVSAVVGLDKKYFNGSGSFGIVTFSAQSLGQASLDLQFIKGSTTDSNIIDAESNQDVLGHTDNLNLVIQ